jgi:hypothetical protein
VEVGGISPGRVGDALKHRRELRVFLEERSGNVTVASDVFLNKDSVRGQNHQTAIITPSFVHRPSFRDSRC